MKRVFIIHGWGGNPTEGWFPWLKRGLEVKEVEVHVLEMPDTDNPTIEAWVPFLIEQIGIPDMDTYLVGHSIGCQTVLRYLERINVPIGGSVCVAGWFTLMNQTTDEILIAEPWISTPINYEKVKKNSPELVAIFSDNDDVVPIENQKLFEERLEAKTVMEHAKGHFSGGDGITKLPIVLIELEKMMN